MRSGALEYVGSQIKPAFPALAGGFFTTEPPGKSFEIYPVSDVAFFFFFNENCLPSWQSLLNEPTHCFWHEGSD